MGIWSEPFEGQVWQGTDADDYVNGIGDENVSYKGEGGDDTILGGQHSEAIYGQEGNDSLNGGGGDDIIHGGADDDTIKGGSGHDFLSGGWNDHGNDTLMGNSGNDTLFGYGGNDFLDGGSGIDEMTGGSGNDIYVVDSYSDQVIEYANGGIDTVRSWLYSYTLGFALNTLVLEGPSAKYGTGNGLDNNLYGNNNNNYLAGMGGNDTLYGLNGNDTLDGGTGVDIMHGGGGNDTYIVNSGSDEVIEAYNQGVDTVKSRTANYTLSAHVEKLILDNASAINGTGNGLDNRLTGNGNNNTLLGGYGDDILEGNGGSDELNGGFGADTMKGGAGNDWYVVDNEGDVVTESANRGEDTVASYLTSYWLDSHVENLVLTASWSVSGNGNNLSNDIIGNDNANALLGLGDDDYLVGFEGDDFLEGGSGNDTLLGGEGDDTLMGGGYNNNIYEDYDELTGGSGGDIFVLGNNQEMFYGGSGFAKIWDYDGSEGDSISLHGSLNEYTLHKGSNYYGGAAKDTVIQKDGDWIGVLVDTTNFNLGLGWA